MFTVKDNEIFWNESKIHTCVGELMQHYLLKDKIVFLFRVYDLKLQITLSQEKLGSNIICLDTAGNEVWRAPRRIIPDGAGVDTWYSGFTVLDGTILTANTSGHLYTLDPETGAVLRMDELVNPYMMWERVKLSWGYLGRELPETLTAQGS